MYIGRRYQVFISSTYTDLIDERREVIQALLELDCIPAGMELFPAADDDQWQLITKVIDDCDYYIVIIGGRYGSISEKGISYTEREYDYAARRKVPILGFLHDDPGSIPASKAEMDSVTAAKLAEFRRKVKSKPVRTYRTPAELGAVVSRSLVKLIKSNPAEGWVRGRFATTSEMSEELSRLRAQVAEEALRRANVELEDSKNKEQFAQGSDPVALRYITRKGRYSFHDEVSRGSWSSTWDEIFTIVGPVMMDEAAEDDIRDVIEKKINNELAAQGKLGDADPPTHRAHLDLHSFGAVKVQFRALGLIEKGTRKRYARDTNTYWGLTKHGDQYLVAVAALHRNSDPSIIRGTHTPQN